LGRIGGVRRADHGLPLLIGTLAYAFNGDQKPGERARDFWI